MNDFTKEELKQILKYLLALSFYRQSDDELASIIDKLNPMIDNYCEHRWMAVSDSSGLGEPTKYICDLCNRDKNGRNN